MQRFKIAGTNPGAGPGGQVPCPRILGQGTCPSVPSLPLSLLSLKA